MRFYKGIYLKIIILFLYLGLSAAPLYSQPPPPPGGSSGTGRTNPNKLGGATPVGGGIFILLGLGGAYGAFKFYKNNRRRLTD